jgi:autotransporter-associated beta strand protein
MLHFASPEGSMAVSTRSSNVRRSKLGLALLATAPVAAALWTNSAIGQTATWDSGGANAAAPQDGPGLWDTTTNADWSSGGGDSVWTNGQTALFGTGTAAAGTVNIDDASGSVSAAGIIFNAPGSGNYTIGATGSDSLVLSGTVTVNGSVSPTISAPIAGAGFTVAGTGTLNLAGTNTFTGPLLLQSNLVVNSGSNLGAATAVVDYGATASNQNVAATGTLTLNGNATVGGFNVFSDTATTNKLTINTGSTLTVNGALIVGVAAQSATTSVTNFTATGGGSMVVAAGANNIEIGVGSGNNSNGSSNVTADFSGLTSFVATTTGTVGVGGLVTRPNDNLTLASTSSITASVLSVGDSNQTGGNNNAGGSVVNTLNLGATSTTIQANTINIGNTKAAGQIKFAGSTGSVTISGTTGGSSTANITIGRGSSATDATTSSNLLLAGHNANVQAGTVIVGEMNGASGGNSSGTMNFDTGSFTANALELAVNLTGTSTVGTTGVFTFGGATPNTSATGVLTVNNTFFIADNVNSSTGASKGTFTMNGGTANINTNITVNGTFAQTSTLTLAAGTLNMTGHAIGSTTAAVTTVNLPGSVTGSTAATLENLGGTGINGAGLNMNGGGTLILGGNNSYSGGTTVSGGSLQVGTGTLAGNLPAGGNLTVNGTLSFGGSSNNSIGSVSGSGTINAAGTGNISVSGSGGPFGGTFNLSSGGLELTTTGTLGASTFNMTGGALQFDLGGSNAGQLNVSGTATLGSGTFNLGVIGTPAPNTYTVLTAGTLSNSLTLNTVSIGRQTFTPAVSGNNILVTVSGGGPANLTWIGSNGGAVWDNDTTKNWWNPSVDATEQADDFFFTNDNVTFDNSASSFTVNVTGTVSPSSTIINSSQNYLFQGTGAIAGIGELSKSGTGTLTVANANTYSGATVIANGTVKIGGIGALPAGTPVTLGDASGDSGVLDLNGNPATISAPTIAAGAGSSNAITNSGSMATLTVAGGTTTYSGAITAAVALNLTGGTLTLAGTSSYTGNTSVNGGALLDTTPLTGTGNVSVASGATLTMSGTATLPSTVNLTNNGATTLANNPAVATLNGTTATATMNLSGQSLTVTGGGSYTGVISDSAGGGNLNVNGGTLILGGLNTFAGGVNVNSGTLEVGASTGGNCSLGSGTTTINAGATLIGTRSDAFGFAPHTAPATIVINGGTVTDLGTSSYRVTSPNYTFTGGTLTSAPGNNGDVSGNYSLFGNASSETVTTNAASTTATISAKAISFQVSTNFNVASGTTPSGIDLLVTSQLLPFNTTGVMPWMKSGAGVMDIDANSPTLASPLTISAGALQIGLPTDTVAFSAPLGNAATSVTNNSTLTIASSQNVNIANPIGGPGVVNQTGTGTTTLSGTNGFGAGLSISAGALVINNASSLPTNSAVTNNAGFVVNANSTAGNVAGNGTTTVNAGVSFTALGFTEGSLVNNGSSQINGSGTVGGITGTGTMTIGTGSSNNTLQLAVNSGGSTQSALVINTGATLDITNNHIFITYGSGADPIASIQALLASGYDSGAWDGTGINSSTAAANSASYGLGFADSADPGNPAGLPSGTIEVAYTVLGDTNLDRAVNGVDFGILAANFNKSVTSWDQGDFNYDGIDNGVDFGKLAANFNKGASGADAGATAADFAALDAFAAANGLLADVPEPASMAMLAVATVGILHRRRRKNMI